MKKKSARKKMKGKRPKKKFERKVTSTQVIGNGSGMNYNNIIEMD